MSRDLILPFMLAIVSVLSCRSMELSKLTPADIASICEPRRRIILSLGCYQTTFALALRDGRTIKAAYLDFQKEQNQYVTSVNCHRGDVSVYNTQGDYSKAAELYNAQQAKESLEAAERAYIQRVHGTSSREKVWKLLADSQEEVKVERLDDN